MRFTRWEVLDFSHKEGRKPYFACVCDCGNLRLVDGGNLTREISESCGCLNFESRSSENLIGSYFGRWEVIDKSHVNERRIHIYVCVCECGEIRPVEERALKGGASKSCGCLDREKHATIRSASHKMCPECRTKKPKGEFVSRISKYSKTGPYCRGCHKEIGKRWKQANPEKMLLSLASSRAKKSGLKFNISVDDIVIPKICPLLGIPLKGFHEHEQLDNIPTLDRIDNSLGYVRGNVWVISMRANRLKSFGSPAEIALLAKNLARKFGKNKSWMGG